jgi:hypothetical protein
MEESNVYTVHFIHHPAPGKMTELRAALEERARLQNAGGAPHIVSQQLYAAEPSFVSTIRFESLAAVEEYNERNAKDPAFHAYLEKLAGCHGRPPISMLYEQLFATPRTGQANYVLRRTFYPNPGKAGELRSAVEKRAHTPSPGAVGKAVSTQVIGPDRNNLVLATLFPTLAAMETYLKAQPADSAVQAFATQVGGLSSGGSTSLFRLLVRVNS